MKVLVIGAGIAGSALAFGLRQRGFEVTMAEARGSDDHVGGAFLYLAPNGVNALDALGLPDVVGAVGGFEASGTDFFNARGRKIAELDGSNDRARYGAAGRVVHRSRLTIELQDRAVATGARLLSGHRLVRLDDHGKSVDAHFENGAEESADIVIGADGIWSATRRLTFPASPGPRFAGILDCGSVAPTTLPDTPRQQMTFGRKAFFGFTVHKKMAYWFSNIAWPTEPGRGEFDHVDPHKWMAKLRQIHAEDAQPIGDLLRDSSAVIGVWPTYALPIQPEWTLNRVVLIGDAAHAVSSSTGQGASLALEDAATLAVGLTGSSEIHTTLESFVSERKRRVDPIVKFGEQIGARKASRGLGSAWRDLTLPFFLRLGSRATHEQYSHRVATTRR